ncbi:hypothetical protein JXI42_03585 [bacterium]|nr:hypothetical protein [bacterium]
MCNFRLGLYFCIIILFFLTGCEKTTPSIRARKQIDYILSKKLSELPNDSLHLEWTIFDTLSKVAEEEGNDSALSLLAYYFDNLTGKSRIDTQLGVKQMLVFTRMIMASCDSGAIYIAYSLMDLNPCLYLQKVEHYREDLLPLSNFLITYPEYRESFKDESRISKLFTEEEWLAGKGEAKDPIHWIVPRAIEKGKNAPPVHFTLSCPLHLVIPPEAYYQKGLTLKVGEMPDSLSWARMNAGLLMENLVDSLLIIPLDKSINNISFYFANPVNLAIRTLIKLVNYDDMDQARELYVKLTPVFDTKPNWWLMGRNLSEDGVIDTNFIVTGAKSYLADLPDSLELKGWDKMVSDMIEEMEEKN